MYNSKSIGPSRKIKKTLLLVKALVCNAGVLDVGPHMLGEWTVIRKLYRKLSQEIKMHG